MRLSSLRRDPVDSYARFHDQLLALRPGVDALRANLEEHDAVVLGAAVEPRLEVLVPQVALASRVLDHLSSTLDRYPRSLVGRDVGKLDGRVGLDLQHLGA